MQNIAIFASGTGSNARKIMEHFLASDTGQVVLVVTNNPKAGVLDIASAFNIDAITVNREDFYQTNNILDFLEAYSVDFIALAGFLWLMPANIIAAYPERILNIHPALLPKYGGKGMYGMHVHEAVKAAGDRESGITIHFVNERYDEGAIVFQASCPIEPEDSATDIAHKVLALEHQHYPAVIEKVLSWEI